MKRKLYSALAILLCLSLMLSACGNNNNKNNEAANSNNAGTVAGTTPAGNAGGSSVAGPSNAAVAQGLKPPEITGVVAYPADGIGVAGKDYKELATGSANDWGNIKIPYFNMDLIIFVKKMQNGLMIIHSLYLLNIIYVKNAQTLAKLMS
jgi:hypothetical protein